MGVSVDLWRVHPKDAGYSGAEISIAVGQMIFEKE
jgi:hypothetical protein